jgi:hypothetical protein
LAIQQVEGIIVSTADATDYKAILNGIALHITFKILPDVTTLLYVTNTKQTALYIWVHVRSYVTYCLTKLGWEADAPL